MLENAILGAGQIGVAIACYLEAGSYAMCEPGTWENGQWRGIKNLHICIPYEYLSFSDTVVRASIAFMADNVIIHSTVPPGTTAEISKEVSGATKVYYSPVVGRHDKDGFQLRDFSKFHAGPTKDCPLGSLNGFSDVVSNRACSWGNNPDELEFAKIMSTTYMYWNLMFQKELYRVCMERGYDFEKVYTLWNENYNNGYRRQHGGEQFIRPVFKEVDLKPAGGHCLGANLRLDDNPITRILLEWEEKAAYEQRLSR